MKHIVQQIHFVGIGGAGMSGIAEVLLNLFCLIWATKSLVLIWLKV